MAASGNEPVAGARLEIGADEKQLAKGLDAAASTVHQFTKDANRQFGQMAARIQGYVENIDATQATVRLGLLEQAVTKLGGAGNLTAPQLTRVQAELVKLAEQGGRLPPSLQAIHDQFLKGKDAAAKAADTYKLASEKAAEAKRNLDAALGRIGALADQLSGKGAGREMAELAKAVEAAGGASKLSAPALDTVRQRLVTLQAAGAKVPPSLQGVRMETDKLTAAAKAAASGQGWSGILGAISPQAVVAGAAVAGLTALTVKFGDAAGKAALETATYASRIKNLSDSYNMNTTALQRLKVAAEDADLTVDDLAKASTKLANNLIESPQKFRELGLSVQELLAMSPDEQLFAVADALRAIENPTRQTHAAMQLLGKSGPEALRLLKTDMRAAADEGQRLGRVLTEEQIAKAAQLKSEIDRLNRTWEALRRNLASLITDNEELARGIGVVSKAVGALAAMVQDKESVIGAGLRAAPETLARGLPVIGLFITSVQRAIAVADALQKKWEEVKFAFYLDKGKGFPEDKPKPEADVPDVLSQEGWEEYLKLQGISIEKLREQAREEERLGKEQQRIRKEYTDFLRDQLSKEEQAIRESYDRESDADKKYRDFIKEQLSKEEQAVRESLEKEAAASATSRAKSTEVVLAAEEALAAARARGSDDVEAAFAKIEAARDRAIEKLLQEKDVTQEAKEAGVALYEELSEEEKRYAAQQLAKKKHQELLQDLALVTEGFGELINIFDMLGVKADSGLGKAARAGEQLAKSAENFAKAGEAFASGNYLAAAVEGLKGVGQVIGAMKTLFSEPSWKKVGREAGRVLGMEISEELAKQIEKTAKELKISIEAASLLNLSRVMQDSRRDAREFGAQIAQLMAGIANGSIPAKEGVKELGTVFNEMRAAAADAGTVGDKTLTSILKLARELGGAAYTDEMRAFTGEKLDASAEFLNQWIEAFAKLKGLAPETMSRLGAQGAEMFMANFQAVASERGKLAAVAMFGDGFEKLKEQLKAGGNEAALALLEPFERWQSYVTDETLGPLLQMSEAARGQMVNLADAGYLNVDTFRAMQESGALLFDSLTEKGMALPDALEAIAPTIQAAISAAEQFGVPLDDDMERLRDLAEQNGYTFQTGPMQQMVDILKLIAIQIGVLPAALERSATSAEAFGARANQVFDETAAGAERMTDDIVTSWDDGTDIVELLTEQMGKEVGQEITAMADAAETVFGYMTDDLEASLAEWPEIAEDARSEVHGILEQLPSGISIPIDFPIHEPERSRFPGGGGDGGSQNEGYAFGGIEDFGRESIVAVHGREAIVPEGGAWFMDMLRQAVREGGAGVNRSGDIYLLVDTRGGVRRFSRAEFRQVEAALAGGVIKVPQRVVSERIG